MNETILLPLNEGSQLGSMIEEVDDEDSDYDGYSKKLKKERLVKAQR